MRSALRSDQCETLPGPGGSLWPAPLSPSATAVPGSAAWSFLTPRGGSTLCRELARETLGTAESTVLGPEDPGSRQESP